MLPIINIFNFSISTYAIAFAIGIALDFLLVIYINKFFNEQRTDVICCFPYWIISFCIGAKLFYIIENVDLFSSVNYYILSSGFSFTGGMVGGFLVIFLYCMQYKIKYRNLLQIYIIVFPLTCAFGKIGCFFAGCCKGINEYPIQIVEALVSFIITLYIILKIRNKSIIFQYLILYSISRFIFDFWRECRSVMYMNLSFTQFICMILGTGTLLARLSPSRNKPK